MKRLPPSPPEGGRRQQWEGGRRGRRGRPRKRFRNAGPAVATVAPPPKVHPAAEPSLFKEVLQFRLEPLDEPCIQIWEILPLPARRQPEEIGTDRPSADGAGAAACVVRIVVAVDRIVTGDLFASVYFAQCENVSCPSSRLDVRIRVAGVVDVLLRSLHENGR